MNKASRGNIALFIIQFIIYLLCVAGLSFFMFQERVKRIKVEEKLSVTEKNNKALAIELDQTQLEFVKVKDQAKSLANQLEQEKKTYQDALAKADQREEQVKELEKRLKNEKEEKTNLAKTLTELRKSYDSLTKQLNEAKMTKVVDKEGVTLNKIIIKPKGPEDSEQKLTGRVLVINKEFHFVVIDLGKHAGVDAGDKFRVYQNSEEIGEVQVEKVYDLMSTAIILSGSQEKRIKEDSIVRAF